MTAENSGLSDTVAWDSVGQDSNSHLLDVVHHDVLHFRNLSFHFRNLADLVWMLDTVVHVVAQLGPANHASNGQISTLGVETFAFELATSSIEVPLNRHKGLSSEKDWAWTYGADTD